MDFNLSCRPVKMNHRPRLYCKRLLPLIALLYVLLWNITGTRSFTKTKESIMPAAIRSSFILLSEYCVFNPVLLK